MQKPVVTKLVRAVQKKTGLRILRLNKLRELRRNPKRVELLKKLGEAKRIEELHNTMAVNWTKKAGKQNPTKNDFANASLELARINKSEASKAKALAKEHQRKLIAQRKQI